MAHADVPTPFGPDVPEIPLANPPLVKVIAQVTFPPVLSLNSEDFVAPIQQRLKARYPYLVPERSATVAIDQEGIRAGDSSMIWRFQDKPGDRCNWRVSVASRYVALDVTDYSSRRDFFARFQEAISIVAEHADLQTCERIGVRYIDRVDLTGDEFDLRSMVKPELLGMAATELGGRAAKLEHTISDTVFKLESADCHLRTGILPAKASLDPAVEASADPSWVLDVDVYTNVGADFDVVALSALAEEFAAIVYRVFRWAVTDTFLTRFGAKL